MNFSETFIRRPIATSLMMAAIALFGLVAYRSLPVSDLPNVDFPTLLVTAQPSRREPGDHGVGRSHAAREPVLEHLGPGFDDVRQLAGLHAGDARIRAEQEPGRRRGGRAVGHHAGRALLPHGMPTPPTFTKVNPADQPILYLAHHLANAAAVDAR